MTDSDVLAAARRLHLAGGDKALSFGALSRATGLAASTLAQRFASVEGLQIAAARDGWRALNARLVQVDQATTGKGAQRFLKALDEAGAEALRLLQLGGRDAEAGALAQDWRRAVEQSLVQRLGQGERALPAARAVFALWQGQGLWGMSEPKIKDLARRLM